MEYVRLGAAAVEVSRLCLGTWMFGAHHRDGEVVDERTAHAVLDAAWEHGINFIDTANVYGQPPPPPVATDRAMPGRSERYLGAWLRGRDREDVVLSSKVFFATRGRQPVGLSRKIILAEIDGTLERLGTDYVDLYYLHGWHDGSPLEESLAAMNDLVRAGKVHYVGVSNFSAWQLVKARWLCERNGWAPITAIQPRYNAADGVPYTVDPHEMPLPDLFDACRDQGVAVCAYAPLAGGFLSGKYTRTPEGEVRRPPGSRGALSERYGPFPGRWWEVLEAVQQVADELDAPPSQVALRWAATVDGVTCIPVVGGRDPAYLRDNVAALDLPLTPEQRQRIADAGTSRTPSAYTYA